MRRNSEGGFVLVGVVLSLAMIAVATALLRQDSMLADRPTRQLERINRAYQVAEAGFYHQKQRLVNAHCRGYEATELSNARFGSANYGRELGEGEGDRYSTEVHPNAGPLVRITSTAVLEDGTRTVFHRDRVPLMERGPKKAIFQLIGGANAENDTWISSFANQTAVGNTGILLYVNSETGDQKRILLKFDLTELEGTEIDFAKLSLYEKSSPGADAEVRAHRLLQPWSEGSSWEYASNPLSPWPGGDYVDDPDAEYFLADRPGWRTVDVTEHVRAWVGDPATNHGFILVATPVPGGSTNTEHRFHSEEATDERLHPRLAVGYLGQRPACGGFAFLFSTESTAAIGGWTSQNGDVVKYDPTAQIAYPVFDEHLFDGDAVVDAVHQLDDRTLVMSTSDTESLPPADGYSGTFFDGDLFRWDLVDLEARPYPDVPFLESDVFVGGGDIDAVFIEGDWIYFSTKTNTELAADTVFEFWEGLSEVDRGGRVLDGIVNSGDIVRFRPGDRRVELVFSDDMFDDSGGNVNAIHRLRSGNLVFSTHSAESLYGVSFENGDLVEWDPISRTASVYFDGDEFENSEDLTAVSILEGEYGGHPGSIAIVRPAEDVYFSHESAPGEHEESVNLFLGFPPSGEVGEARVVLRFDVQSRVPRGSTVLSAILRFYEAEQNGQRLTLRAFRLQEAWQAGSVAWSDYWANEGGTFDPNDPLAEVECLGAAGYRELDMTSIAQQWVNEGDTCDPDVCNFGLILDGIPLEEPTANAKLRSVEAGQENRRPELVIHYVAPSE